MIKLVIFDLDGVLVESRELHFEALNQALSSIDSKYVISKEEHLCKYDALTTKNKLSKLSKEKGLPESMHDKVWSLKQEKTLTIINEFSIDERIQGILKRLKNKGYTIACATNSIRSTAKLQLI